MVRTNIIYSSVSLSLGVFDSEDRYKLTPSNTPSRYSSNLLKWVSSRLTVSCAIVRSISGMIYDAVYGFDVPAVPMLVRCPF
jgi:hypothetical protein